MEVNDDCIPIADFPNTADRILWDSSDARLGRTSLLLTSGHWRAAGVSGLDTKPGFHGICCLRPGQGPSLRWSRSCGVGTLNAPA